MKQVRLLDIDVLSEEEKRDVLHCMRVILESDLIYDEEFQTRVGIYRDQLREIIDTWPPVGGIVEGSVAFQAINGSLSDICYGVPIPDNILSTQFGISRPEMIITYRKMRYARTQGWGTSEDA